MKQGIYIFTLLIFFLSCNTDDNYIKNVYVNIEVNLNLPEYSNLTAIGNSIFIEGGVKGMIIYHFSNSEYRIYDRNCSYEPSLECSRIDSINGSMALCGCCESAFLLDQDGVAANSPAILGLKQYNYSLQNNLLYIFN